MYEMRSTTSGPETTLTDIIYLGGVVQELEIGVRNGSAETLKVMRSAPIFWRRRQQTGYAHSETSHRIE